MTRRWWYHPYILQPLSSQEGILASRRGALLRIEFPKSGIGYADCHPWESCGDLPLDRQLEALAAGVETPLLSRSLLIAWCDAEAREKKVSLLHGKTLPRSHCLALDLHSLAAGIQEGHSIYKLKGLSLVETAFKMIPPYGRIRIDLDSSLTKEEFVALIKRLGPSLSRVDFFEDPFPYDEKEWRYMQTAYGVSLGADRASDVAAGCSDAARFVVFKPAVQEPKEVDLGQEVVVTSYLDHPIGQVAAAYFATEMKGAHVCGLNSHRVYQKTPFSERLSGKGAEFVAPEGTGLGFDDLLGSLLWRTYDG